MSISAFIQDVCWDDLPDYVRAQARRCLLDTFGTAVGGRRTDLSASSTTMPPRCTRDMGAHLWLDGREVSPPGAALANGMTIDSLDIHDGERLVKGHASVAIVPSALATLGLGDRRTISGR